MFLSFRFLVLLLCCILYHVLISDYLWHNTLPNSVFYFIIFYLIVFKFCHLEQKEYSVVTKQRFPWM